MEDDPAELLVNSADHCGQATNGFQSSKEESCSVANSETPFSSVKTEIGSSSGSSSSTITSDTSIEDKQEDKCVPESNGSIPPYQLNADFSNPSDLSLGRSIDRASTTFTEPQDASEVSILESLDAAFLEDQNNSNSDLLRDESFEEAISSGLGFLVSSRDQGLRDGSVLHIDVVSISSNILSSGSSEISNREMRRNSRRLFWDAFSRRGSGRAGETEDVTSRDRWHLDLSSESVDNGTVGDFSNLGGGIRDMNERRRRSRSEVYFIIIIFFILQFYRFSFLLKLFSYYFYYCFPCEVNMGLYSILCRIGCNHTLQFSWTYNFFR